MSGQMNEEEIKNLYEVAETIRLLAAKNDPNLIKYALANEWIDVKDRLPKINEEVLVFLSRGKIEIRFRLNEYYADGGDLYNRIAWSDQGVFNDVTHWMPLPEPPK